MRCLVVLAALASGCIKTTNLGEGTTTKRRVLETRYVGDALSVGPGTVTDSDVALPVHVDGTCDVKAEVRVAQVMRQKRVGLEWFYWISGGALLALPFGSIALLKDDASAIFPLFGLTGVGFLAYGIYGAVRHNKTQNKELSAKVDTASGRERCQPRTALPGQLAVTLPSGKRLDVANAGGQVAVPIRDLELSDASAPWQLDGAGLHAEWKRDDAQRDQIAAAVAQYKPRLVVERLELTPARITAGDRVAIRASVRNVGGSASRDGESVVVTGPFADTQGAVSTLPPQGTQTVELSATVPVERDGQLEVLSYVIAGLDVRKAVLDVARKPRPSLALYCTLPDARSSWNGTRRVSEVGRVRFKATCEVANLGDAAAANIEVAVVGSGFDATKLPIAKLAPLASTVVTIETEPTNSVGTVDLTFVAAAAGAKPVKHTRKVMIR